jgi:CHAT domain-containing protein
MVSESKALAIMRTQTRHGAYRAVTNDAETLLPEIKTRSLIVLERSRAFLRQGRPIDAESVLASANLDQATLGQRLILTLEAASLQIYRRIAIQEALETAKIAFATTDITSVDPVDWAEAERVHVRILLTAAIYYEIPPEAGRIARDRLLTIAQTLEQAGHLDESLAARLTYAERLETLNQRLEALANLADDAVTVDRPALAAEAQVIRAEQLLVAGTDSDSIRAVLDRAAVLYAQIDHVHGLIDVQLVRAKLAVERELVYPQALEDCLRAYQQIDFPKGMLNVLMDLSQLAHDRGDTATAIAYRQQMIELAETVGMGLALESYQTAQIDLLMRNSDYGAAIERCQAAIASDRPLFSKAGYAQLLATVYSLMNNLDAACVHGYKAIEMFEARGAVDSASTGVIIVASNLSSFRQDDKWQEAENLLSQWISRDEAREDFDAAINKRELVAQIKIEQFLYSPTRSGQTSFLDEAEQAIQAAEALAKHLSTRDAAKRLGSLQQLRGQIYQARGDEDQVIQTWRNALAIYDQAGLLMNIANCHYILGAIYLNRANLDLMANFGEAERHFRDALTYYDSAAMRGQAADTRFMFARLYTNASVQVEPNLAHQLLDAAIDHLSQGEFDYDAVRREFTVGSSVLEIQQGKRALIQKSQRIYELALEILCLFRPDPLEAWNWTQRAKARALSDVLGIGSVLPARITANLEHYPESFSLVTKERELMVRINTVQPDERILLREEIDALQEHMAEDPQLTEYLELRLGATLSADDLPSMAIEDSGVSHSYVCVDWIAVGDRLFLLTIRPNHPPQVTPLPIQLSTVQAFVSNILASESFRDDLKIPETLRPLDPLITPLIDLCAPEELLVLSPTRSLHALPLHALEINGAPLLARHPIVYCPSLGVLRHCLARRRTTLRKPTAALFGDPSGDRSTAANLVLYLEQRFETRALINESVTRHAFTEAISGCDFIHFQGHAAQDPDDPLDSYLKFADSKLTAREVFELANLRSELVTLAACESAANVIETGDEPLGLIPAFLYAGTNSVLATLWKVNQTSAAATMRLFYDRLTETNQNIHKAQALRQAMLTVRDTPGFDSPYHWAPFVLYGDWH